MSFESILSLCIAKWRQEGIPLLAPESEETIRRTWRDLGERVSDETLLLYMTVGGFKDNMSDDDFFFSLWPLDKIRELNEERLSKNIGIQFCDHSIEIVTWEMRYEDERHSSIWSTFDPWHCSDTAATAGDLTTFFRIYLKTPFGLIPADA